MKTWRMGLLYCHRPAFPSEGITQIPSSPDTEGGRATTTSNRSSYWKQAITNLWGTLTYKVREIKIISPDDIESILIQPGKDMITLLTCHPYASGGKYRYLVYCDRVTEQTNPGGEKTNVLLP